MAQKKMTDIEVARAWAHFWSDVGDKAANRAPIQADVYVQIKPATSVLAKWLLHLRYANKLEHLGPGVHVRINDHLDSAYERFSKALAIANAINADERFVCEASVVIG